MLSQYVVDKLSAESISCASNDFPTSSTFPLPSVPAHINSNVNIDGPGNMKTSDRRPQRSSRMNTYNETMLSGSWIRRKCGKVENRTILGETLVEALRLANADCTDSIHEDQHVGVSVVAEIEATADGDAGSGTSTRRWTRADVLAKASEVIEKVKSIPGKRRRDHGDMENKSGDALKADSRNCSDQGSSVGPSSKGPTRKRARFATTTDLEKVSLPKPDQRVSKQAKTKHWLKQGLYVGQDRDFNPKLTETKNKAKKTLPNTEVRGSKSSILPFPMFAGQRSLELGRTFRLPFDVFSPLPPGQPRPDEWRKTRTNVFVGEAANVWKKSKRLESSACLCTPEGGCEEDCLNRFMLYECDDTNCALGPDYCRNRSFTDLRVRYSSGGQYHIGVEVMKTIDRGYGVRSNRTFNPNQIIVEYTGEIITQDECDKRMNEQYKDNECYYLMSFEQNMIVDATRGSIARFVNHSCEPNCRMIKWVVAGKPRMALFAGDREIMTGEELTYDYNFDPFSIKNVQECRCGAVTCRGVLGPKPKEAREVKDALRSVSGGKRKFQPQVPQTLTTHKKPKLAILASVKDTFASIKSQTTDKLTQARDFAAAGAADTRQSKIVSKKSVKGVRRPSATEAAGKRIRRRTAVTYSRRALSVTATMQDRLNNGTAAKRGQNVLLSVHARGRPRTSKGTFAKKVIGGGSTRDVAQDLLDLAAAVASDSSLSPESDISNVVETPVRKTANPAFSSHARTPRHPWKSIKINDENSTAQSISAKLSAHARARPRGPGGAFVSSKKQIGESGSSTAASNQSSVDRDVACTATRHIINHDIPPNTDAVVDTSAATTLCLSRPDVTTAAPTRYILITSNPASSHPSSNRGTKKSSNNGTDSPPSTASDCLQSKSAGSSAITPMTTPATTPSATGNLRLSAYAQSRERTSGGVFVKNSRKRISPSISTGTSNSANNRPLSAHAECGVQLPDDACAKRKRRDKSPSRAANPKLSAHARKRQRGPSGVFLGGKSNSQRATARAANPKSIAARRKSRSSTGTFLRVDDNDHLLHEDPRSDLSSSEEEVIDGTESILQAASRVSDSIRNAMSILKSSSKQVKTEEAVMVSKE